MEITEQQSTTDLKLSKQEREVLLATLQGKIEDLRFEIRRTDSRDFRDRVIAERDALKRVLEKFRQE